MKHINKLILCISLIGLCACNDFLDVVQTIFQQSIMHSIIGQVQKSIFTPVTLICLIHAVLIIRLS